MIKSKKAQGLSMSTIIIALLALLVLVVVGMIFSGSLGDWAIKIKTIFTGQKACGEMDGKPVAAGQSCEEGYTPYLGFVKGLDEGFTCCVPEKG